jgi:HlyD family secretion protein
MKAFKTAAITGCALLSACGAPDDTARVVGELASDRIELSAEFNEPIVEILTTEGAAVTAGQLLLRQDDTRAAARLKEADAALAQQQARLDELLRGPRAEQIAAARANLEGATRELAFRSSELDRMTKIHAKGLASDDALDLARVARDSAVANRKLRLAQLQESLAGTTVEELAQAEHALQQLAARRESAAVDLERLNLRAPVDGIVDSRLFELGERPSAGQAVIIMLSGAQPYARVFVPEQLRVRVAAGTAAVIHVDGLSSPVRGRVRWVSNDAAFTPYYALTERDRSRLSYRAKIDIAEQRDRLPDGVPVEVEFPEDKAD